MKFINIENLSALPGKIKSHPIVSLLAAFATAIGIVVSFGNNLNVICEVFGFCSKTELPSPLEKIGLGRSKIYIEQLSVLGPPQYNYAASFEDEYDPEGEIADGIQDNSSDNTNNGQNDVYTTHQIDGISYVIRYSQAKEIVAYSIEASFEKPDCHHANIAALSDMKMLIDNEIDACLGRITFKEFLTGAGRGIRSPFGKDSATAKCWGWVSIGGASGSGSGAEISCERMRHDHSEPNINYHIKIGLKGKEVAHSEYIFDDRSDLHGETYHAYDQEVPGSFEGFIEAASELTIQYIIVFKVAAL